MDMFAASNSSATRQTANPNPQNPANAGNLPALGMPLPNVAPFSAQAPDLPQPEGGLSHTGQATSTDIRLLAKSLEPQTYNNIASMMIDEGNHEKALEYHRKALAIAQSASVDAPASIAATYASIGSVLKGQGKHQEALENYLKALAILEKVLGTEHIGIVNTYDHLSELSQQRGQMKQAIGYELKSLAIREKQWGTEDRRTGWAYQHLGKTLHAAHRYAEALDYRRRALNIKLAADGDCNIGAAGLYDKIGQSLQAQGKPKEALENFKKALAIGQTLQHPDVEKYQRHIDALGHALKDEGVNTASSNSSNG